ncbi:MAG: 5-formyltetrahydrofolate cyclo-ligase [Granulosicoccus sp.]
MHDKNLESEQAANARRRLRKSIGTARSSLPKQEVITLSQAIAERAFPLVCDAPKLAGYLALGCEVDVTALLIRCRNNGQTTFAPLIKHDHTMGFAPFDETSDMTSNKYGIKEPFVEESKYIRPEQLDAAIIPLLGFDDQCNRMGMGGGYYDRSFAHRRTSTGQPVLIGVAYELQGVEEIQTDWWDVPLDYIVTEKRIIVKP